MLIPTVKIKKDSARGWSIINESDFDPDRHELFDAAAETSDGDGPIDLDAMDKAALREVLDAHGVEYDGRKGEDDLRALARRAVFVDL